MLYTISNYLAMLINAAITVVAVASIFVYVSSGIADNCVNISASIAITLFALYMIYMSVIDISEEI